MFVDWKKDSSFSPKLWPSVQYQQLHLSLSKSLNKIDTVSFKSNIFQCISNQYNNSPSLNKLIDKFCETIVITKNQIWTELLSLQNKSIKTIEHSPSNSDLNNNIKKYLKAMKIKYKDIIVASEDIYTNLNISRDFMQKGKINFALEKFEKWYNSNNDIKDQIQGLFEMSNKWWFDNPEKKKSVSPIKKIPHHNKIKAGITSNYITVKNKTPKKDLSPGKTQVKASNNLIRYNRNMNNNSNLNIISSPDFSTHSRKDDDNDNMIDNFINWKKELNELRDKWNDQVEINKKLKQENINTKANEVSKITNTNKIISPNLSEIMGNLMELNTIFSRINDTVFQLTFGLNLLQSKILQYLSSVKEDFENLTTYISKINTDTLQIKNILLKVSLSLSQTESNSSSQTQVNTTKDTLSFGEKNQKLEQENEHILKEIKNLKEDIVNFKTVGSISFTAASTSFTKEEICNYFKLITSSNKEIYETHSITQSNSEIVSLRDQLRNSQRDLMELNEIYSSDIESKSLIESILKKDLSETKEQYEKQINELKESLIKKENEIEIWKDHYQQEEIVLLEEIKENNRKNLEKVKLIYEGNDVKKTKEILWLRNDIEELKTTLFSKEETKINSDTSNNEINKLTKEITLWNVQRVKQDEEITYLNTNLIEAKGEIEKLNMTIKLWNNTNISNEAITVFHSNNMQSKVSDEDYNQIKNEKTSLEKQLSNTSATLKETNTQIQILTSQTKQYNLLINQIKNELISTKNELANSKKEVEYKKQELLNVENTGPLHEEIAKLKNEAKTTIWAKEILETQFNKWNTEVSWLKSNKIKTDKELSYLQEQVKLFESSKENTNDVRELMKNEIIQLKEILSVNEEENWKLNNEILSKEEELTKWAMKNEELDTQRNEVSSNNISLYKEMSQWKTNFEKEKILNKQWSEDKKMRDALSSKLQKDLEETQKQNYKLVAEGEKSVNEIIQLQKENNDFIKELTRLKEELYNISNENTKLQEKIENGNNKNNKDIKKFNETLQKTKEENERNKKELTIKNKECGDWLSKLEITNKIITDKESKIAKMSEEWGIIQSEISDKAKEIIYLEEKSKTQIIEEKNKFEWKVQKWEREIADKNRMSDGYKDQISQCQKKIFLIERAANEIREQKDNLLNELNLLKNKKVPLIIKKQIQYSLISSTVLPCLTIQTIISESIYMEKEGLAIVSGDFFYIIGRNKQTNPSYININNNNKNKDTEVKAFEYLSTSKSCIEIRMKKNKIILVKTVNDVINFNGIVKEVKVLQSSKEMSYEIKPVSRRILNEIDYSFNSINISGRLKANVLWISRFSTNMISIFKKEKDNEIACLKKEIFEWKDALKKHESSEEEYDEDEDDEDDDEDDEDDDNSEYEDNKSKQNKKPYVNQPSFSKVKQASSNEEIIKKRQQIEKLTAQLQESIQENKILTSKIEEINKCNIAEKDQFIGELRMNFENLLWQIQISQKTKDFIVKMLQMLCYSDEEITEMFQQLTDKKKGFFGFLK